MTFEDSLTKDKNEPLEELLNLPLRNENPYLNEWKKNGGYVLGYTCAYVPEEILYAHEGNGKMLPVRMGASGCETTEDADIHMGKFMCSFPRCLLQMGLEGEYDYLDMLVFTSCCEHLRRVYEPWRDEVKAGMLSMISVPHNPTGENRFKWYYDEVMNVTSDINARYGFHSTKASLRHAIEVYNEYRDLMMELYSLRSIENPLLTGSEAMKIGIAGVNMPKEIFNVKLKDAIDEIKKRKGIKDYKARILLGGSFIDDTYLIDIIESTGAIVVTDTLCSGRKYIEGNVDISDDNVDLEEAIIKRYFNKISCPRMIEGYSERIAFTKRLIKEAKVDGVIFEKMSFCDNHGIENLMEARDLVKLGIPVLQMEREYLSADTGRYKTRVQAFIEKINKRK
ncbi:2-hydroxyacyl-CoA dehydratase family protein [Acetobacterium wieringae]|uniref:2-hydroxyacyl-CoA dehydratase subunit D n=1 Tax=Acetobacterium wieringae TaxID=52694 RepID=UPI002B1FA8B1|nr:2-hydroxyacyl-CoA dehydratase family protein [Acetobacterium wieringae]MEA4807265.1 2-hydroxyacyl-CoA dehydratase family protein [Acetobacterium wieringae]